MILTKHELRQSRISLIIWTAVIGFLLTVSIILFPEMKGQMDSVGDMFSSMGSFTAAFGMDRLNFGTFSGYYAVECGNVLGLGGAFFAALCGVSILCKEEKDKTAEFLLTHPVTRPRVVSEKLLAVLIQITAMNLAIALLAISASAAIGESVPWKELLLLHLAYYLMQVEIACICFALSSVIRKGSIGIGLGIAFLLYFLDLIANIADVVKFLKYITPFGYCNAADIVTDGSLDAVKLAIGLAVSVLCVAAAYLIYARKDIR